MLVNGARALLQRRPVNVAVVALANKLARIAWAVIRGGENYRPSDPLVAAAA